LSRVPSLPSLPSLARPHVLDMFLSCPEREVRLPSNCAFTGFECCKKRTNRCVLSVCPVEKQQQAPHYVSREDLALVHRNPDHLDRLLTDAKFIYDVFELKSPDAEAASTVVQNIVIPLRYSVQNLICATQQAFLTKRIVLCPGGGQHHAGPSKARGAGLFCDVPLAWLKLRQTVPGGQALKALYIDVDVHQANGVAEAREELDMWKHFFILDACNQQIWPFATDPSYASDACVEPVNIQMFFDKHIGNKEYLKKLEEALNRATTELPEVDFVFYVSYLDAFDTDKLGHVKVTAPAIYDRDRMVVEWARNRKNPIPMVIMPGPGYTEESCRVTRESMARLNEEFNIWDD